MYLQGKERKVRNMDIKRITEILYALDITSDMDYFDVRKIEQNNVDYEYKSKIYDKENPYR